MGDRLKLHLAMSAILLLTSVSYAARVLQVKGSSAILELSDAEIQTLRPAGGQNIQLTFGSERVDATIKKVANKKILLATASDISSQKVVSVSSGGAGVQAASAGPGKTARGKSASGKEWTVGANIKYVLMGAANQNIKNIAANVKYDGFDLSGVGIYYLGDFGVGLEGEYAMLKGKDEKSVTYTTTQIQFSLLGEYRFKQFSAGGLFTLASNYKETNSNGSDNSLNGMGFGAFFTYAVIPNVRLILDYRIVDYKLDSATIKTSDIRLGAGYYF